MSCFYLSCLSPFRSFRAEISSGFLTNVVSTSAQDSAWHAATLWGFSEGNIVCLWTLCWLASSDLLRSSRAAKATHLCVGPCCKSGTQIYLSGNIPNLQWVYFCLYFLGPAIAGCLSLPSSLALLFTSSCWDPSSQWLVVNSPWMHLQIIWITPDGFNGSPLITAPVLGAASAFQEKGRFWANKASSPPTPPRYLETSLNFLIGLLVSAAPWQHVCNDGYILRAWYCQAWQCTASRICLAQIQIHIDPGLHLTFQGTFWPCALHMRPTK